MAGSAKAQRPSRTHRIIMAPYPLPGPTALLQTRKHAIVSKSETPTENGSSLEGLHSFSQHRRHDMLSSSAAIRVPAAACGLRPAQGHEPVA
jgi:hypothetical protein